MVKKQNPPINYNNAYRIDIEKTGKSNEFTVRMTYKFDKLFLLTNGEGEIKYKELTNPVKEYFNVAKIEEKDGRVVMHVEIEIDKPEATTEGYLKEHKNI
ncbi:MAG TPA: hypothetical protein VJB11_00645 [archaeon]|nr:hypothetical protein [archaeon]